MTGLGYGVDDAVRRIELAYEVRGLVETVTSYDAASAGDVVNQVRFGYNEFAQLTNSEQSHAGAVGMSTPAVQYGYADGTGNTVRPTSWTYPDGRVLTADYGPSGGTDDRASRPAALKEGAATRAAYTYLGLAGVVAVDYAEPDVQYDLIGSGGDYSGLDRFNRIVQAVWTASGGSTTAAEIGYGYDRAGNRTFRKNPVDPQTPREYDAFYGYDGLHRLAAVARGELNGTDTGIADLAFAQCWTLDETGNWQNFRQDDTGDGTWDLEQQRSANRQNEVTGVTNAAGAAWGVPGYDLAGNLNQITPAGAGGLAWAELSADEWQDLTVAEWQGFPATTGRAYVYDAWNRQVRLEDDGDPVQANEYDGLHRRIVTATYTGGVLDETRHAYYSASWQVLEERLGTTPETADAERQFVWGIRALDDLVLRDRDTTGNGTLDERLYALADANGNVIAVVDDAGAVQERYEYDAYGLPEFLDASFGSRASSNYAWETLYAGYRWDATPGLYHVRFRVYLPQYGVWMQRDPIGFAARMSNLYQYAMSIPVARFDSFGLRCNQPPAPAGQGTTFYTKNLAEYWKEVYGRIKSRQSRLTAGSMRDQLYRGCIGITCVGLGIPAAEHPSKWYDLGSSQPRLTHCYESLAAALKVAREWNTGGKCCRGRSKQTNISGNLAQARVFMVQFNDTITRRVGSRDVMHTTQFTPDDSGRYNLETDRGVSQNPLIGPQGNVWEHFRSGNFDFAFLIYDEMIAGGEAWIHANGNGPNAIASIVSHDSLLTQYHEVENDVYDFNCAFYCVACETPWRGDAPLAPVVPM